MNKIIAVTSGKGGTGKSTFSALLAINAAKKDFSVLLIDMDAGMRCLDMILGVSESELMDLSDVLSGGELESSVLEIPKHSGLYLLPAPQKQNSVDSVKFGQFVESISDKYSLIIIDFPAGSNKTFYEHLPKKTDFVCVCNPDPVSVRDAAVTGFELRSVNRRGKLVINKYNYRFIENTAFKNLDDILDQTGLGLLGILPMSDKLVYAFSTGKFSKRGREVRAIKRIYSRILGKNTPLVKLKKI